MLVTAGAMKPLRWKPVTPSTRRSVAATERVNCIALTVSPTTAPVVFLCVAPPVGVGTGVGVGVGVGAGVGAGAVVENPGGG